MMRGRTIRSLPRLALLLPLVASACNTLPYFENEPVNWECGVPDAEAGETMLCPETHPWCACATLRCARIDVDSCASGFEYVDGGCMAATDAGSMKPSLPFDHPSCLATCERDENCDDGAYCNGQEACVDGFCTKGAEPPRGTECDFGGDVPGECRSGRCVPPNCGDVVVDDPEEQCDDGNPEGGDGCEEDCTFTCVSDAECFDDDPCNGTESCDVEDHVCLPGPDVLPNDTRCSRLGIVGRCLASECVRESCGNEREDPGEECDDGDMSNNNGCRINCTLNVCGDGHVNAGVEECDDGDIVDGDGCDADCTWSCLTDEQCALQGICSGCDNVAHACTGGSLDAMECDLDGDLSTPEICEEGTCVAG